MELRFGIELVPSSPIVELTNLSVHAETLGFNYVWITDHFNNRNVYVTLTSIALSTKKIMVGPGVTNPYVVSPVWTASAIASLDEISNGRAVLGIGAGDRATLERISIAWRKPLATIKESVEIMKRLLKGEVVTYSGEVFKVSGAALSYKPIHEIPIYIGAQAPKMLQLAAMLGDGILINASSPKDYEHAMNVIKEGAGDRIGRIDIVAYTSFSVDRDRVIARRTVRPIVAFIVAGTPEDVLKRHGVDVEKAKSIRENISKGRFKEAFSIVSDDMIDAFSIAGTPSECVEVLERLVKLGVTQIVFGSPIGKDKKGALEIVASDVIPHLKV
ncbi:MAG: 5,10-methylenetetrahydromethanopterin reductase [Ignisphaera sp.]|nr:5,10-methylenetetrahydromethanopterin reductase [Ignisphaera sp.]MCX8168279.1 5,10-methylenetetrahydromethanopterin reductase [Ignisphaera sp.]MDW8086038.1 5,10-methylenetetrahydromethanopterin reductase [Ignisphaera sp.]